MGHRAAERITKSRIALSKVCFSARLGRLCLCGVRGAMCMQLDNSCDAFFWNSSPTELR